MLGQLVPCGGGQAVVLTKPRLVLRLRKSAPPETPPDLELQLTEGWWHIRKVDSECPLEVNGQPCDANTRLKPNDVLNLRGRFYRIAFHAPEPPVPLTVAPVARSPIPREAPLGTFVPCGGGPAAVLRKRDLIVGRHPSCDVVLPFPFVSSRHCQLEFKDGHWLMTDLDSTNGTTVDGTPYKLKWVLPGSILGFLGKRYRLEYTAQGETPCLADDDVVAISKQSLLSLSGCTGQKLDHLLKSQPKDEEVARPRWSLDE